MKSALLLSVFIFLGYSCGVIRNNSWKLQRAGHYEPCKSENTVLNQEPTQDIAQLNSTEMPLFSAAEPIPSQDNQAFLNEKVRGPKNDIRIQRDAELESDSLRKAKFPYKHRKEIIMAKKGTGYVFYFAMITLLIPLFLYFVPLLAFLILLVLGLYGIHVHDPREPLFRAEKYVRVFRRYKFFYVLDCLGAIALSVFIILIGEPAGGIFLLFLIPGIIALIASHKLQKRAAELAVSLTEPDAPQRIEEHTNTLYKLKMWRWIGYIGMIPFVIFPIWILIELGDLAVHANR